MDKYLNEDAITAEIMSYVKNRIYNYLPVQGNPVQVNAFAVK